MINVTTRKLYFHAQNFEQISTAVLLSTVLGLNVLARTLHPQLYLDSPTQSFKVLLILVAILAGASLLLLSIKKRYRPQFNEYIKHNPHSAEIEGTDDISKMLDTAQSAMLMIILFSIGMFIGSVVLFSRFFNNSNLATYVLATTFFLGFSYFSSRIDHSIFILKLAAEMSPKEANETTTPKKHPWEEEKQDENEIWRNKMLKLESEVNSSKE